jgi:hypothetical protein
MQQSLPEERQFDSGAPEAGPSGVCRLRDAPSQHAPDGLGEHDALREAARIWAAEGVASYVLLDAGQALPQVTAA